MSRHAVDNKYSRFFSRHSSINTGTERRKGNKNTPYFSRFWPPSSLIQKIRRCNRRPMRNLLPSKLCPLCELSGEKYLGCGAVIICLLVSIHGNRDFNPALHRNWAIYSYVIRSLDCIAAGFIAISVPFKGCCCWFRTNFRKEEGTMRKQRMSNMISFASEYFVRA